MALNNDTAQRQALKRAMRIAEIRVEDAEDMNACVNDLVKTAGLDETSAKIVAAAYRESMMPSALEAEGIDPSEFMGSDEHGTQMTADFAKDIDADHDDDMAESDEDEVQDDNGMEDSGEVDDNVATLEVEVPADKVDEFQQALEKAMAEVFGDGAVAEDNLEEDSTSEESEELPADNADKMPATANRKVQNMNRTAREQREAILASLANTRTASDFEYAADAQYSNEGKFDKMTMQSSEGNSLRDQNPTFAKQDVPTLNPEHLGLKNELNAVKKDGNVEDSAMYEANFDLFSGTPSQGVAEFGNFELPTQTENLSRTNVVVASDLSDEDQAEEFLYNELKTAGVEEDVISNLTFAEGLDLYRQINASKIDTLAKMANIENISIAEDEDEDEDKDMEDKATVDAKWESMAKEAEVFRARLKTAYGVSTKLCLAGLISADEVEANVDLWLNDGLTVKAMLASGAQMLRVSQSAEQRVVSAHAEKTLRTASAQGVATIPGYAGSTNNVSTDLQQALKNIFSKPEFEG